MATAPIPRRAVVRPAPPRPPVVDNSDIGAGIELEDAEAGDEDERGQEPEMNFSGGKMVIQGMETKPPELVEDDNSDLPPGVLAEVNAGKAAIEAAQNQTALEIAEGNRMREHHARLHAKRNPAPAPVEDEPTE